MENGKYIFRIVVFNRFYPWLRDERTFFNVTVYHAGRPVLLITAAPSMDDNVTGDVRISWEVMDDLSDDVHVYIYYRTMNENW